LPFLSDEINESRALPEVGELVVATVSRITDYGAYVTLDEYEGLDGLLHISEISSGWVRNIRDHIHEKEKTVLKVLRVDPKKVQVDLSLRRVNSKEKQTKLLQWKMRRKAEFLLKIVSEKLGVDSKTFVTEMMKKLEDKYDSAYTGLEELLDKGEELANRLKIPPEWAVATQEVAKQEIKLSLVKIKGNLRLTNTGPDGVGLIKNVLMKSKTLRKPRKVKVDIYTLGAPKYVVEVTARNYKEAEKTLKQIGDFVVEEIKAHGGEGEFKRSS
jgi:translation initiation factor 2 subunit 1